MLKIRLQRVGRKNDPSFRVVCVDSRRSPKVGKHTEVLGSYDPKRDHIAIKGERVKYWISNGAQVSDTMHNLLIKRGVIKGKKIHVAKEKKKVKVKEEVAIKEEVKVEVEASAEEKTEVKEPEAPKEEAKEEAEESKEQEVVEEQKEQKVAPEKKEVV